MMPPTAAPWSPLVTRGSWADMADTEDDDEEGEEAIAGQRVGGEYH